MDRVVSLTDFLEEHGVEFVQAGEHQHATLNWLNVDCPECSPGSQRYRLGIHLGSHAANCWSCGPVNVTTALAALTRQPWGAVRTVVRGLDRTHAPRVQHTGKLILPDGIKDVLPDRHRQYLESRGFNAAEIVKLWGVKGIGLAPDLAWRLFIPIVHDGRTVSWTTRQLATGFAAGRGPRYKSAQPHQEAIHHKDTVYGGDYARHAVIVCEGPTDVWRIGPGAVATFGLSFTAAQVEWISKFPVRVVTFDTGKSRRELVAAQRAARRLCWLLEGVPGKTFRVELKSKDPGESSPEEIKELRQRFLGDECK